MKRIIFLVLLTGCGSDPKPVPLNLALIGQTVKESAPAGFKRAMKPALASSTFKTTFFEPGPTSIFRILDGLDDRINGYNDRSLEEYKPCTEQEPVAYTVSALGETITMYAQCYEEIGPNQFAQVGTKDGVTYVYIFINNPVVAIATPDSTNPRKHNSHAYISLGGPDCPTGTWYGCSYGTIHVQGNSATLAFEMTTAGLGFQYCGAQLRSDGTNVYGAGSLDGGATCMDTDTLCVQAGDVTTPGTCDASLKMFALPSLGRMAGTAGPNPFAASKYPASPTIKLDGSATDSVHFGPTSPTPGVGNFNDRAPEADAGI
jgi:hypothetical protein